MRALAGNRIASNVIANASVAIVNGAIGILTVALLARELGPERYGVWVLIGLVTTYLVLGDVGLIAATGRRLAMQQASEDRSKAARIASTHVAASLALAAIVLCVAAVAGYFFGAIFAVPPAQQHEAFGGLLLTGISTALYILFSIFTCQLWARERLDVIAAIEIPVQVGKLLAILLLIDRDTPLTVLAAITIPANLLSGLAAMIACRGWAWRWASSRHSPRAPNSARPGPGPAPLRLPVRPDGKPADWRDDRRQPARPRRRHLLFAGPRSRHLRRRLRRHAAQAVAARAVRCGCIPAERPTSSGSSSSWAGFIRPGSPHSSLAASWRSASPSCVLARRAPHEAIPLLIVLAIGESLAMSQSVRPLCCSG